MTMEVLLAIMAGFSVTLTVVLAYKGMLENKVQAQEHIQGVIGDRKTRTKTPAGIQTEQHAERILKKRKKKKTEDQTALDKLEMDLEKANLMLHPNEFVLLCFGSVLVTFLVLKFILGQNLFIAVLGGGGGYFLPVLYLKLRIMLRMKKAAAQFADVLDMMVNGFKTGYGFSRAIQMVADNYKDPWGTEFAKMAAEMNLGLTQEDALINLARRVPNPDVDLFVTGMMIQKETGGNMTELLSNLSKTCRDRYKLFQKVGAISAQGKLSAAIVIAVPFLLMLLMWMILPGPFTKFVTNPIGQVLLGVAGIWMCVGIFTLWKIVQIEV